MKTDMGHMIFCKSSDGSEDAITGIAETGKDIALFIELFIERAAIDFYVRMLFLHQLDAFGSCQNTEEFNIFAASLFDEVDCGNAAAAGG